MEQPVLLERVKEYASAYADEQIGDQYVFHSKEHFEEAVKAASELADAFVSEKS